MSDTPVNPGDLIGRRLFGEHKPSAPDTLTCDVGWFSDKRLPSDLSVDILGRGQADKGRVRFLTADADKDAEANLTSFNGWAAIIFKNLRQVRAYCREIPDKNPHHAEFDRSEVRSRAQEHHFATNLAWYFQLKGFFVPPARGVSPDDSGALS